MVMPRQHHLMAIWRKPGSAVHNIYMECIVQHRMFYLMHSNLKLKFNHDWSLIRVQSAYRGRRDSPGPDIIKWE